MTTFADFGAFLRVHWILKEFKGIDLRYFEDLEDFGDFMDFRGFGGFWSIVKVLRNLMDFYAFEGF